MRNFIQSWLYEETREYGVRQRGYKRYIRRKTMEDLTFGEQVKIILGRKGMTIKQLAEMIEERTGKKMSRQNLTQRLGRDNFQEQDMRMIAEILDCPFHLSIITEITSLSPAEESTEAEAVAERTETVVVKKAEEQVKESAAEERDLTIGELYEIHRELSELEENAREEELQAKRADAEKAEQSGTNEGRQEEERRKERTEDRFEPVISHEDAEEDREAGEVNPYTGREYQSNSVRMHPTRIGYVQVYDRSIHKWTDMTEWAFLGLQERKKALFGKAYEPPIYLD